MRAPEMVGLGNAKVTLSFAAWKEGKVAPATLELPVSQEAPEAKKPVPLKGTPDKDPPLPPKGIPDKAPAASTRNQLRQIGLAMHNYLDTHRHFPSAAIFSKGGQPLLSWRVALLPYLEEGALYKEFKLDEAWDSPHNKKLLDKMPAVFALGKDAGHKTRFRVFTGPETVFDGAKGARVGDILDGFSNTALVVEARDPVPWTKPEDFPHDPKAPLPALGNVPGARFHLLMADGAVVLVPGRFNEGAFRALLTPRGNEPIGPGQLEMEK